ncbi:hypothetical protein [Parvularcula maris]|uniref:Uncharacterized protein n=1 Tax=Parvularcula maris TaxID=2965077 RepID=A0A9X2L6T1_9PROT|nr:hypothetical protein [Parvularcula maris]MCQ8184016.1 hypothetical protein [Parvularcula maris]
MPERLADLFKGWRGTVLVLTIAIALAASLAIRRHQQEAACEDVSQRVVLADGSISRTTKKVCE